MQLDSRCGQLRLVESLRKAEVGRVVLVASRLQRVIVASCCNARAVCNSKSLRGLDAVMLGQSITAGSLCGLDAEVVVGRSISRFRQYIGLTGGVSIWLLARNSESLRGPDVAMLV